LLSGPPVLCNSILLLETPFKKSWLHSCGLSTFGKVVPNLEPYTAIPLKTTHCSPPNYTCIDAGGGLDVKGDCNANLGPYCIIFN